ncbi:hypothetical protein V6N13_130101 [Hibiscus sabdariffa]|uniref:Uncharacterized protein n=1 Tax=Hibiscus sabdariffa TaxID=183260 RepID=A0ABR2SP13_9ROSI
MVTYFHGNPEIQAADGLQTLFLMNPPYVHYSDTPPPSPNNLVFLDSNSISPHVPPSHTQQFVGIPLHASTSAANQDPGSHEISPCMVSFSASITTCTTLLTFREQPVKSHTLKRSSP